MLNLTHVRPLLKTNSQVIPRTAVKKEKRGGNRQEKEKLGGEGN